MAIPLKGLEDLTGDSAAAAIGFGLGVALGRALEPLATKIAYEAWETAPIRVPDAGVLASGVSQGQVDEGKARAWAASHGVGEEAFAALVNIANTGPEIGLAMRAWRRGDLTEAQFATALRRTGLEEQWYDAVEALKEERLDPAALATAIHRGIVAGHGLIVAEPPQGAGKVPHVAQSDLDPIAEAASHGIDPERMRILVGNTGLPPGLMEMLSLLNRGKVTEDDVKRAVANSNLRNEYMDVVLELRRQLPTARDFLENALRGYRTLAEAIDGAALHGMTAEDATMIYQNQGRPMALRQITQALARGGKFEPEPGEIRDPYRASIVEGNVKPAYYDLAYANRYNLPSPFVIRSMAAAGELTRDETETLLLQSGWPPWLAKKAAGQWAGATAGAGKAETKAELEDEYAGGYITETEFRASLDLLGYTGHVQDLLVSLNDARRLKRYREKVVDAIGKAYIGRAIDAAVATADLAEVHITGQATTDLLRLWDLLARVSA